MNKKILAGLLVILMLVGLLTGCSSNGGKTTDTGKSTDSSSTNQTTTSQEKTTEKTSETTSSDKPKETIEISMTVLDRGHIPAELGDYSKNAAVDYINEEMAKYGIKVSVVPVPRNQSYDKMNAMLAAGTAPDILWEYSRPWCNQLRVQGVILPVDDIIEKYSTDYKAYFEKNKDLLAPYVTMDDGKMYAFTSLRAANSLPTAGVWYRHDLVEEVGMEPPETLEEVIEISKAVKQKHPDIVPIAASLHYLNIIKGTYGYASREIRDGDRLIHPIFSENYRDAMEMARRFYQEKIVDQEYITDTTYARQQQLWNSGNAIFYFNVAGGGYKALVQTVEGADPRPLPPFKSKYGQFMLTPQNAARFFVMLNADMANDEAKQEACVTYLDWVLREGWYVICYGKEGVTHTVNKDGLREAIPGAVPWPYYEFALLTQEVFVFGQTALGEPDEEYKYLMNRNDLALKQMLSYPIANVLPYDFTSDAYAEFNASFSSKLSEMEAKMITEPNYSVEQGIEELQKLFKELGGEEVWQAKNEWYQANKGILENFAAGYNAYKDSLLENSILPDEIK